MSVSILVIEDDQSVRNLIAVTLKAYGYHFEMAKNGTQALRRAVALQPDIYILDLGLPDIDGMEIIRQLRSWTRAPIIIVSARSEIADKIHALDAGADDYLTKPFSVEELLARIRVACRKLDYDHSPAKSEEVFVNGNLRINYTSGLVFVDGQEVHLTPIEYKLLCLLARNTGKVLTRNYILKEVWGNALDCNTQSLRVFMASLRKKIERPPDQPTQIQTHVGIGYRLMRISDQAASPGQELSAP